jgi:hypothetical protein
VQVTTADTSHLITSGSGVSAQSIVPVPQWCLDNPNTGIWGVRTSACEIYGATYETYELVNGAWIKTGEANLNIYNLSYGSTSSSYFVHQVQVSAYAGYGPALDASVEGSTATANGACATTGVSFPPEPLLPFNSVHSGEADFQTTATAVGAIGTCATTWNVLFVNPGHTTASLPIVMDQIRCDNATGANGFRAARVGCVIPWYASAVVYSASAYSSLASHVARAQASGLPGNSFAAPLVRTTNQATIDTNRNLACGKAPSITGLSCDEYPLASSLQGLSAGGTLRSFSGCQINAPQATGPTGASACMITATENSAQGGIMAGFYYDERVLDGDPFRVLVGA